MERSKTEILGGESESYNDKHFMEYLPEMLMCINKRIYKALKPKSDDDLIEVILDTWAELSEVMEELEKRGVIEREDKESEQSSDEDTDSLDGCEPHSTEYVSVEEAENDPGWDPVLPFEIEEEIRKADKAKRKAKRETKKEDDVDQWNY